MELKLEIQHNTATIETTLDFGKVLVGSENSIKHIPQTLTPEQQEQARENIDAYSKGEVNSKITDTITDAISGLVGAAPEALDTIEELAAALENNADIVDVLNASIATKADKAEVAGITPYVIDAAVRDTAIGQRYYNDIKAMDDKVQIYIKYSNYVYPATFRQAATDAIYLYGSAFTQHVDENINFPSLVHIYVVLRANGYIYSEKYTGNILTQAMVQDTLESLSKVLPLSANQGKSLNDKVTDINSRLFVIDASNSQTVFSCGDYKSLVDAIRNQRVCSVYFMIGGAIPASSVGLADDGSTVIIKCLNYDTADLSLTQQFTITIGADEVINVEVQALDLDKSPIVVSTTMTREELQAVYNRLWNEERLTTVSIVATIGEGGAKVVLPAIPYKTKASLQDDIANVIEFWVPAFHNPRADYLNNVYFSVQCPHYRLTSDGIFSLRSVHSPFLLKSSNIKNNLTTTTKGSVLDASQGKILADMTPIIIKQGASTEDLQAIYERLWADENVRSVSYAYGDDPSIFPMIISRQRVTKILDDGSKVEERVIYGIVPMFNLVGVADADAGLGAGYATWLRIKLTADGTLELATHYMQMLTPDNIVDNLDGGDSNQVLSATQGRMLKELIEAQSIVILNADGVTDAATIEHNKSVYDSLQSGDRVLYTIMGGILYASSYRLYSNYVAIYAANIFGIPNGEVVQPYINITMGGIVLRSDGTVSVNKQSKSAITVESIVRNLTTPDDPDGYFKPLSAGMGKELYDLILSGIKVFDLNYARFSGVFNITLTADELAELKQSEAVRLTNFTKDGHTFDMMLYRQRLDNAKGGVFYGHFHDNRVVRMTYNGETGLVNLPEVRYNITDDITAEQVKYYSSEAAISAKGAKELNDIKADKSNTYTKAETDSVVAKAVSDLVGAAPETLDTLEELAVALGENEDMLNALAAATTEQIKSHYVIAGQKAETELGLKATAEGIDTTAAGNYSHAEGDRTRAMGESSHAEGRQCFTDAPYSHAEGDGCGVTEEARGAHVEGLGCGCTAPGAHAEGIDSGAEGVAAHAEGYVTQARGDYSHSEGSESMAEGVGAHAEGSLTQALSDYSHAEGSESMATGEAAHAEGSASIAEGVAAHAEGYVTQALGDYTHAEGSESIAEGLAAHAEGINSTADGDASHVEGRGGRARPSADSAHVEGRDCEATHPYAHAEGLRAKAHNARAHAEGRDTVASGPQAHAEGDGTIAAGANQHVQGKFNVEDTANKYAHIVGGGTDTNNRRNLHTVDWDGNAEFEGKGYFGGSGSFGGDVTIPEGARFLAGASAMLKEFTMRKYAGTSVITDIAITKPGIYIAQGIDSDNIAMYANGKDTAIGDFNIILAVVSKNADDASKLDCLFVGINKPSLASLTDFYNIRWLYGQRDYSMYCGNGIYITSNE